MTTNRPMLADAESDRDFHIALHNIVAVSNSMNDKDTDRVGMLSSQLLLQCAITGVTIGSLIRPVSHQGFGDLPKQFTVVDIPSLAILTRGVLETFLVHHHVCVQQVSAEEREYRLLWWDWHEVSELINSLEGIGSKVPKLSLLKKRRDKLKISLKNHPWHGRQSSTKHGKSLLDDFTKNKPPKDAFLATKSEMAKASGIHPTQHGIIYKSLSQYAHAQPVAVSTLLGLSKNSPDLQVYVRPLARYATSYLLLILRDFLKLFPQARSLVNQDFERLEQIWTGVLASDLKPVKTSS